jgi:ABC-type branched-subunit amino acid transport system substrate-binding protein
MTREYFPWRLVAVVGVTAALLTACTGDGNAPDSASESPDAVTETVSGTPLYLVDGNLGQRSIQKLPDGTMTGVQGSLPGAQLSEDFRRELEAQDPALSEIAYSYAPESYDAVTLVALAAQAAHTDAGVRVAEQLGPVSEGGQSCGSFEECDAMLRQGEDINYEGVSGSVDFDAWGDVTSATIGLFGYDDTNTVPSYNTAESPDLPPTFVEADARDTSRDGPELSTTTNIGADGRLVLGGLVPTTGSLSTFAQGIDAAMTLAVDKINAAGGVLGRKLTVVDGDGGTETAQSAVDQQLAAGVDAIVSAASSQVTRDVLDQVSSAGVLMVGSSQTSPELSDVNDGGLYYRTSPSDELQGQVLADRMFDAGAQQVAIIARDDAYGQGLALAVTRQLKDDGSQVVDTRFYDPAEHRFDKDVQKIAASGPDTVVVIGYDETSKIIKELVSQGLGPNS